MKKKPARKRQPDTSAPRGEHPPLVWDTLDHWVGLAQFVMDAINDGKWKKIPITTANGFMDYTSDLTHSSSGNHSNELWLAATIQLGRPIYHPVVTLATSQVGTLNEQLQIARLAASNPWAYPDPADARAAARRTILDHARKRAQ